MMGDYFWTTQTIETGYLFSYKLGSPGKEIPKVILDRDTVTWLEQDQDFISIHPKN